MIRAVAYVRVSTKEQDEKVQINAIEKFAKENSIEVLKYFVDKGESRMKKWENRPAAKQLVEFLEKGQFREALYYRLRGVEIEIPPLRERPDDIIALIERFLPKYAKKYNRPVDGLTPKARDMLLRHRWNGNVRELMHSLEQAVLLSSGSLITADELRLLASSSDAVGMTLRDVEAAHIRKVLASCDGNISRAAEVLGIHRNTLTAKLREIEKT